jgi:hypothetical protein
MNKDGIINGKYKFMIILALLIPTILSQRYLGFGAKCPERIFSDVRHVEEVDDYVGTEIVLHICPGVSEISGEWNEYEGGYEPAVTKMTGNIAGESIRLSGINSEGKVEFIGSLTNARLRGKLIWYIGSSRQEKDINFLKSQKPVRPPK